MPGTSPFDEHLSSDAGRLLLLLAGYDFARFMRRYRSPRSLENYRTCREPERAADERAQADAGLSVLQWQNKKAVLRTHTRSLPVVS